MSQIIEKIIEKLKQHNNAVSRLYYNDTVSGLFYEMELDKIEKSILLISQCFKNEGKLILVGNGGSASQCDHLATEFVSIGYPAIALTNISTITALGNDFGFDNVFSKQLECIGKEQDILIALSTSGNSSNILKAIEMAKSKNMKVIGLTGINGGRLIYLLDLKKDIIICIPSEHTQRIQELHIIIGHIFFELFENQKNDLGEVNETEN